MRRNPTADQPAEETASPISGVGREPLRLQVEATLVASEHDGYLKAGLPA
jgi:hypothetical protein